MDDYIFRYDLIDSINEEQISVDSLAEYYKKLLILLTEIMEFTSNSQVIDIDGFKFINSNDVITIK